MITMSKTNLRGVLWGAILVLAAAPLMISAQESIPVTEGDSGSESPGREPLSDPNPTQRPIYPREDQSAEQQLSDELECYDWTCDQLDWDPYEAYDYLVDEGYAVALTREDMQSGLLGAAAHGAVVGSVAGEIAGHPGGINNGAEIGVAIAVALELIRSNYVNIEEDPEAKRTVSRFERNLRQWDSKFAGCMRRKGYRVPSS